MSADALLSRLEHVRQTAPDRWVSRCPSHEDHRPSLAIRLLDGDRLLLHCFAGCSVHEVVDALGLCLSDLFPSGSLGEFKRERRPFSASEILRCIALEALITALSAVRLSRGEVLSEETRARLLIASGRLQSALEVANG